MADKSRKIDDNTVGITSEIQKSKDQLLSELEQARRRIADFQAEEKRLLALLGLLK